MRIASLDPAATEIVCALGLADELVARSSACDHPADIAALPVAAHADTVDGAVLAAAGPDLVLVGGGTAADGTAREARAAVPAATIVRIDPERIEGVLNAIATIGAYAEAEDEAVGLVELLRERLAATEARVVERRIAGIPPRRVVVLAGLEPLVASGGIVPELVRRAGGWDLLATEGGAPVPTTWERVAAVAPELLVLALPGRSAAAAAAAWAGLARPARAGTLRAVREHAVRAIDGTPVHRPGPRAIDAIAALAHLFDPEGLPPAPADVATVVVATATAEPGAAAGVAGVSGPAGPEPGRP